MADPNDKSKGVQGDESPFLQALHAIKRGLQMSPAVCEAFIKEIQGLDGVNLFTGRYHLKVFAVNLLSGKAMAHQNGMSCLGACAEAGQHRNVDLLGLALLHSQGEPWRKSAESILRKKCAHELMDEAYMAKVIRGHQVCGRPCFQHTGAVRATVGRVAHVITWAGGMQEELSALSPTFLALAGALVSAAAKPAQRAGIAMYAELFQAFEDGYVRQVRTVPCQQHPRMWHA